MNKENDFICFYLNSRIQIVKMNDCYSQLETVTHGIPQGTVLNIFFYLLYTRFVQIKSFFLFSMIHSDTALTLKFKLLNIQFFPTPYFKSYYFGFLSFHYSPCLQSIESHASNEFFLNWCSCLPY